ncbi:GTP-binding protein [Clostridium sulfidigenes]|uniref:GTPase HflX n=1 Tax=Clostridium sulfidigenes TaxID=318464 RepID=A0A084JAT2_9CLOT|nr:GTP-binding protein [Clostridium sulfidigenes]
MERKGIVVGININNENGFEESMVELKNLCMACDIEAIGELVQNSKQINKAHYIGSGKLDELKSLVNSEEVDIVIFNNELSSSQLRNIEKAIECEVIDRTALILSIFAERAKTREAKLQVEVARLQYLLPRLIGANENLGRQSGGVGTKNKGAGEKKLELDRRKIEAKIAALNKELEELKHQRETQRNLRRKSSVPQIALVGYTNAGKSSIMNSMIDTFKDSEEKKVFEKDMLFATLETSIRSIKLDDNKKFLLSDTVGFVSNLPHNLIKAFRSTLEEVCEADLLLHVVDISNPDYKHHLKVTNETLKEIGAESVPMIYVYNKIDLVDDYLTEKNGVYISAKKNLGIDKLVETISTKVFNNYINCNMFIPYDKGNLLSYLNDNARVIDRKYRNDGAELSIECSNIDYEKYREYVIG